MLIPLELKDTLVEMFKSFSEVVVYPPEDDRLFHCFFRGGMVIALKEGPFVSIVCRDDGIMSQIKELIQMFVLPQVNENEATPEQRL